MDRRRRRDPEHQPMTLGNTVRPARVRLIVTCKACGRQVEPDVAALVERHGADLPVREWAARLVCSGCGAREADFVVSGSRR